MRFDRLRRRLRRIFDRTGNAFALGEGSACPIPKDADVRDCSFRLHGKSTLIVESGAKMRNVSFQVDSASTVRIASGTVLEDVDICVWNRSELSIGKDCSVHGVRFVVEKGKVAISDHNVLSGGSRADMPVMTVVDGCISLGDHNHLQNSVWVRFGGNLSIGRYNCINAGSEIRCDESVTIGSYNMVSYECDIWDTNTHSFYSLEEKKAMFEKDFPAIGKEPNKPDTKPVAIGDGNWIGKRSCILKGSVLGNETVVGTRAIVSNMTVGDGGRVLPSKSEIK